MSDLQMIIDCVAVLGAMARRLRRIEGRVRIQKIMYLLKRRGLPQLGSVYFEYHHYGPFSRTVADGLVEAVRIHVLHENRDNFDDEWQRFEYKRGPLASEYAGELDPQALKLIHDTLKHTGNVHWRTLELAATIDYLEQRYQFPRDEARRHALALKPACKPYQREAIELLSSLGL